MRDSGHWLLIGAPSSHQFTVALRTMSLNHKAHTRGFSFALLRVNLQGAEYGLLGRKLRGIAIAVPFQARDVVPFMFGVGQRLGFGES